MMTVREVIARVRLAVNDPDASNPRWPNTDLIGYVNDGIREFTRLRPDLTRQNDGSLKSVGAVTDIGDDIGLPREYLVPLANYAAEQVFSADSADVANAERAAWHRDAWQHSVIGA